MTDRLTWLITGCSSGLGECVAKAALAAGDQVIATARSRNGSALERLAPLEEAGAAILELDVSAPAEVLRVKVEQAWAIYGKIDVLVNNAGYIDSGIFEEIDEDLLLGALRTNALGPLSLTRAMIPHMRSRNSGTILFMSSVGAYFGAPGSSAYVGSKGLLETIVPTLATEIGQFGIRTCLLTSGFFRTKVFAPDNIQYRAPSALPVYEEMNKAMRANVQAVDGRQPGDPAKAGKMIVDAVKGQGPCQGKPLPLILPIGSDAITLVTSSLQATLDTFSEWKEIASSTDIEAGSDVQHYPMER